LVAERRIHDLLPNGGPGRAEASGVLAAENRLFVIFDDSTAIAILDQDLSRTAENHVIYPNPRLAPDRYAGAGYEDIARDPATGHLYLLVEAVEREDRLMPRLEILDADFQRSSQAFLDFAIEKDNKGMEGLSCLNRAGELTLVALCEGNWCSGGKEGERPGGGRLQLFRPAPGDCEHLGTINLPPNLWFVDYSSVAIRGDKIAVLSQQSAALWIGEFRPESWAIADHGSYYGLPRDKGGNKQYGTAEGLSWLDEDHLVVVSDKAKKRRFEEKERSVHIFRLP